MKRFLLTIAMFFSVLFLSGCIDLKINQEITINPDKTMEHSMKILASDSASYFRNEIENRLSSELKNAGFSDVSKVSESGYFGILGKQYKSLDDTNSLINNEIVTIKDCSTDFFIFKYVNIDAVFDLTKLMEDNDPGIISISEYKFTLNLPVKINKSNADNIFNEGKSAVWYLTPNQENNLHLECVVPNAIGIGIIAIIGIVVFFIILLNIKKPNKKEYSINDDNSISDSVSRTNNDETRNDIKFCPNCGQKINDTQSFCGNCGTKIERLNNKPETIEIE